MLHNNNPPTDPPKQDSATSNASSVSTVSAVSIQKSSMVYPVYLSHPDSPGVEKLVFALVDSQSCSSYIVDSILDSFDVPSQTVDLTVHTMNGKHTAPSRKTRDFVIRG